MNDVRAEDKRGVSGIRKERDGAWLRHSIDATHLGVELEKNVRVILLFRPRALGGLHALGWHTHLPYRQEKNSENVVDAYLHVAKVLDRAVDVITCLRKDDQIERRNLSSLVTTFATDLDQLLRRSSAQDMKRKVTKTKIP